MKEFWPGTRVKVFDSLLFKDDKSTPLSHTVKLATVTKWYSYYSKRYGWYPNCIDVKFDHRKLESHGHFTTFVDII